MIIHANGEYRIKNHGIVDNGSIDKWGGIMHWEDNFENLSLKDQKAMGIGIFTGSLIGVRYVTHVEVDGGALVYDEIEDFSGNYEYIDVDM